jgi:hypothetical protein
VPLPLPKIEKKWSFSDFIPLPKSEKMFIFSLFGTEIRTSVFCQKVKKIHFFHFFVPKISIKKFIEIFGIQWIFFNFWQFLALP